MYLYFNSKVTKFYDLICGFLVECGLLWSWPICFEHCWCWPCSIRWDLCFSDCHYCCLCCFNCCLHYSLCLALFRCYSFLLSFRPTLFQSTSFLPTSLPCMRLMQCFLEGMNPSILFSQPLHCTFTFRFRLSQNIDELALCIAYFTYLLICLW